MTLMIKRLCNVIDFLFEGGKGTHICISKNNVECLGKKPSLKHLIQNCYFMVGKSLFRQKIGIPMDPAPFWANLSLYTYENDYMSELISNVKVKACHFHASKGFIDDLGWVYSMMFTKRSIPLNYN